MTKNKNVDENGLHGLYASDPAAKALLDHFASRERNRRTMPIDRVIWLVGTEGNRISRGDAVRVFKRLDELGCGKFMVGRKGHPTRFDWSVGMTEVGRVASGESVEIQPAPAPVLDEAADDEMIDHRYRLRKELDVLIQLPATLTRSEAIRLANFIQTLPFETADSKDGE